MRLLDESGLVDGQEVVQNVRLEAEREDDAERGDGLLEMTVLQEVSSWNTVEGWTLVRCLPGEALQGVARVIIAVSKTR